MEQSYTIVVCYPSKNKYENPTIYLLFKKDDYVDGFYADQVWYKENEKFKNLLIFPTRKEAKEFFNRHMNYYFETPFKWKIAPVKEHFTRVSAGYSPPNPYTLFKQKAFCASSCDIELEDNRSEFCKRCRRKNSDT